MILGDITMNYEEIKYWANIPEEIYDRVLLTKPENSEASDILYNRDEIKSSITIPIFRVMPCLKDVFIHTDMDEDWAYLKIRYSSRLMAMLITLVIQYRSGLKLYSDNEYYYIECVDKFDKINRYFDTIQFVDKKEYSRIIKIERDLFYPNLGYFNKYRPEYYG